MIEKLRELVETALDWFPEVKLLRITPGRFWVVELSTPKALVILVWPQAFIRETPDLFLVTEVQYWLKKEA